MWFRETRVGWVRIGLGPAKPSTPQLCPNFPPLLGADVVLSFQGVPSHAGPGNMAQDTCPAQVVAGPSLKEGTFWLGDTPDRLSKAGWGNHSLNKEGGVSGFSLAPNLIPKFYWRFSCFQGFKNTTKNVGKCKALSSTITDVLSYLLLFLTLI